MEIKYINNSTLVIVATLWMHKIGHIMVINSRHFCLTQEKVKIPMLEWTGCYQYGEKRAKNDSVVASFTRVLMILAADNKISFTLELVAQVCYAIYRKLKGMTNNSYLVC